MKIARVRDVKLPARGTEKSAGIDFFVPNDISPYHVKPGKSVCIPSGIKVNVPTGFALIVFNKSGVALKRSLAVGACVIDEDYQGEIHLSIVNTSNQLIKIEANEKLLQFIAMPIILSEPVEIRKDLFDAQTTSRGNKGFGSSDNQD